MIQILGKAIYKCTPRSALKWLANSNNKDKQLLYCEKAAVVTILLFLYTIIILLFNYLSWKHCTNIFDIISGEANHSLEDKSSILFHRDNTFCNVMDGFVSVYVISLLTVLLANIIVGVVNYWYQKLKLNNKQGEEDISSRKKIIVHMPVYNESEECMRATIDSIVELNYEKEDILILIVVDGIIKQGASETHEILLVDVLDCDEYMYEEVENQNTGFVWGDNQLSVYNGVYKEVNYSVVVKIGREDEKNNAKPGNRGKKDSALMVYRTINHMYGGDEPEYVENLYTEIQAGLDSKFESLYEYKHMLIVDCDTTIQADGLRQLVDYMETREVTAVCGQTVVRNHSSCFITRVQSFEYFISHLLLKTFESVMYETLVLSGCFTLINLVGKDNKALINSRIITEYTKSATSLYEKNLVELGEDRYLTVLIIQEHPEAELKYLSTAVCETNAPESWKVLVSQRRRWCNSLIVCLFLLFTRPPCQSVFRHIKMYIILIMQMFIIFLLPLVAIMGLVNFIVSVTVQGYSLMPVIITVIIVLLNLFIVLMTGRLEMAVRFVPFFIALPAFVIYMPLYSICRLDDVTWGLTRDIDVVVEYNDREADSYAIIQTPREDIVVMSDCEGSAYM